MRIFAALMAFTCSFALSSYSQGDSLSSGRYFQLGLGLTASSYIGDFTRDIADLYRIHPGANLSMQTTGSASLQLQANAGFGKFAEQMDRKAPLFSSDANAAPNRFVETSFYYADLRLKYRFLRHKRFMPYFAVGAGVLVFTPRDESGKLLREMPHTRNTGETYNTAIPQLPGVVGLQARISPLVSASFDYTYRITPTDYLDNVGQWGSRQGNDALHGLQMTLYFTFRPQPQGSPVPQTLSDEALTGRAAADIPERRAADRANTPPEQTTVAPLHKTNDGPAIAQLSQEELAQEEAAIQNKQFVYYQVREGEALEEIANRFRVRPETIVRLNYLKDQKAPTGIFLRLPDMGISTEED